MALTAQGQVAAAVGGESAGAVGPDAGGAAGGSTTSAAPGIGTNVQGAGCVRCSSGADRQGRGGCCGRSCCGRFRTATIAAIGVLVKIQRARCRAGNGVDEGSGCAVTTCGAVVAVTTIAAATTGRDVEIAAAGGARGRKAVDRTAIAAGFAGAVTVAARTSGCVGRNVVVLVGRAAGVACGVAADVAADCAIAVVAG